MFNDYKGDNMYKLIAIDIDGTLLNYTKNVTEETKRAINYASKKGVYVVLATGRPVQGIYDLYEQLNLDTPAITYNGAIVLAHKKGPVIYECPLSPANTQTIIEKGKQLDTTIAIWYDSKLYTNKLNERAKDYSTISNVSPILYKDNIDILQNGATKILYYDNEATIEKYMIDLKDTFPSDVLYHTSRPYFLEFVNSEVSKAVALQKISEHLNIKQDEIIAIGDGFNDLSMIEYAALGVAMGTAPDKVKAKAQYVTTSWADDGVAKAIYKFIK